MKEKISRLLVTADSLFDARLGTIARINPTLAAKHLHDPAYTARLWDLFPEVDASMYAEMYAKRDRETLRLTQATPVVGMIQDFVKRCAKTSFESPVALVPEIHINFYPYILTDKEKELTINTLKRIIPLKPEIQPVFFSNEELNPLYCRNNYNTIIHYHGHEWLELHSSNKLLEEYKCPNLTMFVPALLDKRPEEQKVPENIGEYFYSLSIFAQLFINLTYVGIDNFCALLSKKPKTTDVQEGWTDEGDATSEKHPRQEAAHDSPRSPQEQKPSHR